MKKKALVAAKSALTAGFVSFCVVTCAADGIYVGTGEKIVHEVASDSMLTENLTVAPRGTFEKAGKGELTIPTSKIVQGWPASIAVAEGSLKICPESASSAAIPESAPAVMQNAAVWFDSKTETSFKTDESGNITTWCDVRETGNPENGYAFIRAVTDNAITSLCPELKERDGIKGLYFQGYGSGCWMNLVKTDGSQATVNSWNVFAVQGQFEKYGSLFGHRTASNGQKTLAFVPGNSVGTYLPMWTFYCLDIPAMHAARTYIDGEEVDAFTTERQVFPSTRFSLLEVEFLKGPGAFQCFFNDRNYWNSTVVSGFTQKAGDRVGGEYICEIVAFTNALTAAERIQVEQYLQNRWFGVPRPRSVSVFAAKDTSVELAQSQEGSENLDFKVEGAGDILMWGSSGLMSVADGFMGRITLKGGSVQMKSSFPYAIENGRVIDSGFSYDGRTVSVSDGEVGVFEKSGSGDLRLNEVPSDVKKLSVQDGELCLEVSRSTPPDLLGNRNVVTGIIPNASFEIGIGATDILQHLGNGGFQGWYSIMGEGGNPTQLAWVNHSAYKGGMNNNSIYWKLPVTVPDGECVLAISKAATVWTTITLPQDGVYALTFMASTRMNVQNYGQILEIAIGESQESLEHIGYFRHPSYAGKFLPYRYVLPRLEAGEHKLWFMCIDPSADKTSLFDDFRLTLIPDEELYEVPNGTFEEFKGTYGDLPEPLKFVKENFDSLAHWTIEQSPLTEAEYSALKSKMTMNYIGTGPVTPEMVATNRASGLPPFCNIREGDGSMVQLYLKNGSSASVTFTPRKGRYLVQSDIGLWRCTQDFAMEMDALAKVSIAGVETDLGRIEIMNDYTMKSRRYPKAFYVDGTTPVTLTLSSQMNWKSVNSKYTVGQLLFDNVKLVPSDSEAFENLVSDGSFASAKRQNPVNSDCWSSSVSTNGFTAQTIICSSGSVDAYGASWHDHDYAAVIVDNSRIFQNISFYESGRHRLSVAARKRVSWGNATEKKSCPVRFWIARDGNTNEIARFSPSVTNFTMYSWAFDVPHPGDDWVFGVEGLGATEAYPGKDMNTLIDDISIVYEPISANVPDIPETLEVEVAQGAKLRLDYPGMSTVEKVRLGGVKRSGVISAETFPEYITGDGALYVLPKGTVLVVR